MVADVVVMPSVTPEPLAELRLKPKPWADPLWRLRMAVLLSQLNMKKLVGWQHGDADSLAENLRAALMTGQARKPMHSMRGHISKLVLNRSNVSKNAKNIPPYVSQKPKKQHGVIISYGGADGQCLTCSALA